METNILDKIDMSVLGRELQQARVKSGLTQEDAARVISVARTTLTAIEKGDRRIKAEELIKLAHAYGRQISDFIRPRPSLAMSQPQFRGPVLREAQETAKVQPFVEELKELVRNYYELEHLTKEPSIRKYPKEYDVEGLKISSAAETVAIEERNRLGLGDGPIPVLRDILEQDVGLRIFYLPIQPAKFSAIYLYDEQAGGCIAINSNHPEERRRWSLAHEYGHFLVHRVRPTIYVEDHYQRKPGSERFADEFALFFLMPTSGLMRRVNDILRQAKKQNPSVADLCTLASFYGVSVSALTQRLEDMKILPTGTWDKLKTIGFKVQQAQKQLSLAPIPSRSDKFPIRYQHLAFQAFDHDLITEGMLANFLEIDRIEARKIAEALYVNLEGEKCDTIDTNLENPKSVQEDE